MMSKKASKLVLPVMRAVMRIVINLPCLANNLRGTGHCAASTSSCILKTWKIAVVELETGLLSN